MTAARIEVKGLSELQASLRRIDADMPKALRLVLNDAAELVLDWARPRVPSRTGRARGSMKARSSQRESRVAIGGRAAPYAPWLDFGGQGRRKGRPPRRPFMSEGRYVYRGLAVKRQDVQHLMEQGLNDVARGAGLDVT
jgi:phage gpG-like protein